QFPIPWIRGFGNRLQPSRSVHVRRRGNLVSFLWTYRISHRHKRRRVRFLKPFAACFRQNRRRERPKNFPMLDAPVQNLFHLCPPRIGHNASISERPRSPFCPPLKPSENFSFANNF